MKEKNELLNIQNYYNIILNKILFDDNNYELPKYSKIFATIPVYNAEKALESTVVSIKNQNKKTIEILILDEDGSISLILNLIKKDRRIILLKNEHNRGILYSKSILSSNAKGKYILQIDQDDYFIGFDLFSLLYYEAKIHNFDLIQFEEIHSNRKNLYIEGKWIEQIDNTPFYQPYLSHFEYETDVKIIKKRYILLWGMLIKKKYTKIPLKKLGQKYLIKKYSIEKII